MTALCKWGYVILCIISWVFADYQLFSVNERDNWEPELDSADSSENYLLWNGTNLYSRQFEHNWSGFSHFIIRLYQNSTPTLYIDVEIRCGSNSGSFFFPVNPMVWNSYSIPLSDFLFLAPPQWNNVTLVTLSSSFSTDIFLSHVELHTSNRETIIANFEPKLYTMPSTYSTSFEIDILRNSSANTTLQIQCENAPETVTVTFRPHTFSIVDKATTQLTISTFQATLGKIYNLEINIYGLDQSLLSTTMLPLKIEKPTIVIRKPILLFQNDTFPTQDYKREIITSYIDASNALISEPIYVPAKWGSWTLYFVCKDGTPLDYDKTNSTHFYCPSEQTYYSGEPYASSWFGLRHNQLAFQARNLGIAFHYTKNISYAIAVTEILTKYASFYPNLLVKGKNGYTSGGKLFSQTLDEAVWCVDAAIAYDLVASTMTEEQQSFIEHNLFRAMAAVISKYNAGTSNWQSWHNAAIGAIGFLFKDEYYYSNAIQSFTYQLRESVLDDGIWHERSLAYHFYALRPILRLLGFAKNSGIDLDQIAVSKKTQNGTKTVELLFSAPLLLLQPNVKFPLLDNGQLITEQIGFLYEFANYMWKNPIYDNALSQIVTKYPRRSLDSLLYGEEYNNNQIQPISGNLHSMGVTVIRAPGDFYLLLKYTAMTNQHSHFDVGSIVLYKNEELVADQGTVSYSLPIHEEYFKTTLAHSTLIVNGRNQMKGHKAPQCAYSAFDFPQVSIVSVNLGTVWDGKVARTIVSIPINGETTLLIDNFSIMPRNRFENEYSYVLHCNGKFESPLPMYSVEDLNYPHKMWKYFKDIQSAQVPPLPFEYKWTGEKSTLRVISNDTLTKQLITASAPNNPASSYHPVAIAQITSAGNTEINHLLVVSDISAAQNEYKFTGNGDSYHIESADETYNVHIYKKQNTNIIAGMLLEKYSGNSIQYIGYTVKQFKNSAISIQGLEEASFSMELVENNTMNCIFYIETMRAEITCTMLDKLEYIVEIYLNGTLYHSPRKATVLVKDAPYRTLISMNVTEIVEIITTGTSASANEMEKKEEVEPKNNYHADHVWLISAVGLVVASLFGFYKIHSP